MTADTPVTSAQAGLKRRMRPIYVAAFVQNVALWVPIEKLFMTGIGFDNGSVAVMAAAYAAVVPLLELPSGIVADRWSRRGVLILAQAALVVAVVIGGLSPSVGVYIVSALFLGVFFALQSGTSSRSSMTRSWRRPATAAGSSPRSDGSGSSRARASS